ncbi:hypothetical protein DL766_010250 [Monosporascus sp. MC13-8B]|uniref:Uncharacterized protein n=1 Tax=Monosporascus cannonballus TaxID=155416 RepID=A0ABY0HAB3_9PEZI|nr:hypothetical protein DL762_003536 [Monosporascus cannonballus]RYO96524.1 hypothetical protein DL763_003143 [Monosporascus cannonballus]RYP02706.1 hypothetical protein DL766_010250 [Monosporascus sp. MC13-8B]
MDFHLSRKIRFCCKALADVGAAYGFEEIAFYLWKADFKKLRAIARHPTIRRHVKTLIYMAANLNEQPISLEEYIEYTTRGTYRQKVERCNPNWLPDAVPKVESWALDQVPLSVEDVRENYRHYVMAIEEQRQMLSGREDFDVLREVFPRLPSLRSIVMENHCSVFPVFYREEKSAFNVFFDYSMQPLDPEGVRQMDAIMHGLAGSDIHFEVLTAGYLHLSLIDKRFFDEIIAHCGGLKSIDLMFSSADTDATIYDDETKYIAMARQFTAKGVMASFLSAMPQLNSFSIGSQTSLSNRLFYPAAFRDISERQEMLDFFELHKDTLRSVYLRDIRLGKTSWTRLLRRMKENLRLDDIRICSWLHGKVEDKNDYERPARGETRAKFENWWLGDPEIDRNRWLSEDLTDWFLGDRPYPLTHPRTRWLGEFAVHDAPIELY